MILRAYTKEDLEYYLRADGLLISERDIERETTYSITAVDDDGEPIASAGLDRVYTHCALAWARVNLDKVKKASNAKKLIREIRNGIECYLRECPEVIRVYAEVSNIESHIKFAKLCGFFVEAVLGNLNYDGSDLVIMRYKDGNSCYR